jgi:hypothetical protein
MPIKSTDAVNGRAVYASTCQAGCHGANGKGVGQDFAKVGLTCTRAEIVAKANNVTPHGGGNQGLDGTISAADTDDLIARIRAFAGVPGYTLSENNGVNFAVDDIAVVRNFTDVYDSATGEYTVIVRRKLATADVTQDVQFTDLMATYLFGVAVMDFDGQNHAGAPLHELSFDEDRAARRPLENAEAPPPAVPPRRSGAAPHASIATERPDPAARAGRSAATPSAWGDRTRGTGSPAARSAAARSRGPGAAR